MKLYLAPIQGMTISFYRNLYADIFGSINKYYAPFIATTGIEKASPKLFKDLLPAVNNDITLVVPQLLSNNGKEFNHFASIIADMGYTEINWNIGCPYPMVTKKKKGSGLLSEPDLIREFLDTACQNNPYDISVKMRLGRNTVEEGIEVIKILNDYPIKNVIIHGRIAKQMYTGTVNLEGFESLYSNSNHEIIYNGDLYTVADYHHIQNRFPSISTFMLGRGALRNPFLAAEINDINFSRNQKLTMLKTFHDAVYSHYKEILSGEKHLCDRMKEFWTYLSVDLDPTGKSMKKLKKSRTCADYLSVVNQLLQK